MLYLFRKLLIIYYRTILLSFSSAVKSGKCYSYIYYCCCLFVLQYSYFSPFYYRKYASKMAIYIMENCY